MLKIKDNVDLKELDDLMYNFQWKNLTYLGEKKLVEKVNKLKKENKRLNNVIDELEKWIDENYKYNMNSYRLISAWDLKDKLKELKGGK